MYILVQVEKTYTHKNNYAFTVKAFFPFSNNFVLKMKAI